MILDLVKFTVEISQSSRGAQGQRRTSRKQSSYGEILALYLGAGEHFFTGEDLTETGTCCWPIRWQQIVHTDVIAPCEVIVPAQNTCVGPQKTSLFQPLGLTTNISRGTAEGHTVKVGSSEAKLVNTPSPPTSPPTAMSTTKCWRSQRKRHSCVLEAVHGAGGVCTLAA